MNEGELMAVSFFYKKFTNPIEMTIQPTTSDLRQSFLNADNAHNFGVEAEARKNLGWINRKLSQFSLYSNFTFVDSRVTIPESQKNYLTSLSRPLMGQSRYIVNFSTEWLKPKWRSNARFYLTYASRRLAEAGAFGLPDIYQEGNTFLDFVYEYLAVLG